MLRLFRTTVKCTPEDFKAFKEQYDKGEFQATLNAPDGKAYGVIITGFNEEWREVFLEGMQEVDDA